MLPPRRDRGATVTYLQGRDRVLGARLVLYRDPELAADLLVEILGGRAAGYQWALRLLAAFEDGWWAA
jgi:hypothetical protein